MINVRIELSGCDDTTYVSMQVTEAERDFLERVAAASVEASSYGCEPTIVVREVQVQS